MRRYTISMAVLTPLNPVGLQGKRASLVINHRTPSTRKITIKAVLETLWNLTKPEIAIASRCNVLREVTFL